MFLLNTNNTLVYFYVENLPSHARPNIQPGQNTRVPERRVAGGSIKRPRYVTPSCLYTKDKQFP